MTTIEQTGVATKRIVLRPKTHSELSRLCEVSGYTFDEIIQVMMAKIKSEGETTDDTGNRLHAERIAKTRVNQL